jgi:hypothetical protein
MDRAGACERDFSEGFRGHDVQEYLVIEAIQTCERL